MNAATLETERLFLREIREEDTAQIVAWRSVPTVYRYFKAPHAITAAEHLRWYRENYCHDPDRLDWIGLEKKSGKPIGVFGLRRFADSSNTAEVSYLLDPAAQHQGYAGEAVRALIQYAAGAWNTKRVIAEIHRKNRDSIMFAQRLGFRLLEEQGDFLRYGSSS